MRIPSWAWLERKMSQDEAEENFGKARDELLKEQAQLVELLENYIPEYKVESLFINTN